MTSLVRDRQPRGATATVRAKMFRRLSSLLMFWTPMLAICAASGILYALLTPGGHLVTGTIYGVCTGAAVLAFDQGVVLPRLHAWIRGLPTVLYIPAAEAVFVVCIMVGNAVGGLVTWSLGLTREPLTEAVQMPGSILLYAFVVSATLVSAIRIRDLIGTEALISILVGRYHRPVQEERIFLFLDVVGSTAYAQQHGDLRAHEFLGAIFAAMAEPVRRHRGSIDDYVGDMALVTWPLARGARNARCVACVFDIIDTIASQTAEWEARFGQVPAFRAALHGGTVVTAEVGVDRHKIAYFGDVVNTTGRLEALCRTIDVPILISSDLLGRLDHMPGDVSAHSLGEHALRGRGQQLAVFALQAARGVGGPGRDHS